MHGKQRSDVVVTVKDDIISVIRTGTALAAEYKRHAQTRKLVRTYGWFGLSVNSPEVREFVATARGAAYEKARELGWIE